MKKIIALGRVSAETKGSFSNALIQDGTSPVVGRCLDAGANFNQPLYQLGQNNSCVNKQIS